MEKKYKLIADSSEPNIFNYIILFLQIDTGIVDNKLQPKLINLCWAIGSSPETRGKDPLWKCNRLKTIYSQGVVT